MTKTTDDFLSQYRFALIGFSRGGKKFGNYIYKKLTAKGLHIDPVNPAGGIHEGIRIYESLRSIPVQPQAVIIAVKASSVEKAVRETIESGIRRVWILGSGYSKEIEKLCHENGIEIIHNRCILMYFGGFPHNIHYFFHRLARKLPRIHPKCAFYDTLGEWVNFKSLFDNSEQRFWMGLPDLSAGNESHLSALYLHQQDSDWSGVLTSGMYEYCRKNGIIAVSTDYRGPASHLNDAALSDISQIVSLIKEKQNADKWIACGVSMGAIAAIQISFLLPQELKPTGVVAVLPAYNLIDFYNGVGSQTQTAMKFSYKGSPAEMPLEYSKRSPDGNISKITRTIPFAVFAAKKDAFAPVEKHARPLVEALKANGNAVFYKELDTWHDPEVFSECYKEGIEFVLEQKGLPEGIKKAAII